MKKYIYYILLLTTALQLIACSEDDLDPNSIFDVNAPERDAFDTWLYLNYITPYNVQFNYKYIDKETDNSYNLVPATPAKSMAMAKLTKHLWIDSYNELLGEQFIKTYCPRIIQLIGSKAYNMQGSVVLGTAEGGLKITLYNVNELNPASPDINFLNEWFFRTMHHEFAHILHQTKNYPTDFKLISTNYQGPSWVNLKSEEEANQMGFVTRYASFTPDEDFVEIIANYITHAPGYWDGILSNSTATGKVLLKKKFEIVKKYLQDSWGIDIDKLRDIVQRRSNTLGELDLINL